MKWSVIALVALGTVAALCASVLVGALRVSDRADAVAVQEVADAREIAVVVAARDLPQGLLLESDALSVEQIAITDVPENFIPEPVLAVGKVLSVALVKGQPVLKSCFAEGSGLRLAASLPEGMRAVGVSLGGSSGLHGLLYAGCSVDVLATYKASRSKATDTQVLLERVRVLGIENKTVVSGEDSKASSGRSYRRSEMVVLMLDAEQAKILQSAAVSATITLAMRHPLDDGAMVIEAQPEPEPEPEAQAGPVAEEYVTEEINGGVREKVTYIKRGDTWQRKEE